MSRTFVLGDIHGAYRALQQCLTLSGFDYTHDRLIFLGDVADGWPDTKACIEELLKIKNLVCIMGNHDWWTLEWMETGFAEEIWLKQGGEATVKSYSDGVPQTHIDLLASAPTYYEDNGRLFVHAGFDPQTPIDQQPMDLLLWDREFVYQVLTLHEKGITKKISKYDEVYIGHTPIASAQPLQSCEVWLMDTGAGWSGRLSMMNIDTKEMFVSDPVPELYPGVEGRKRFKR